MAGISRRELLVSGLAISGSSLLPRTVHAAERHVAQAGGSELSPAALSSKGPRERLLFDFDWRFTLGNGDDPTRDFDFGYGQSDFSKTGNFLIAKAGFDDSTWRLLDLPHDWAVDLPFEHDDSGGDDQSLRSHGYKPLGRRFPATSVGWYRREFTLPVEDAGRRICLEFDGVFRDCLVFVNGCFLGRNNNGYTPFHFDLTDFLIYGGTNCIVVRVDASFGDGWFYEGAGIYRHVWLTKGHSVHIGQWETVIRSIVKSEQEATLALATTVINEGEKPVQAGVRWRVLDANGTVVATALSAAQTIGVQGSACFTASSSLAHPVLWSLEEPHLYTAEVSVQAGGNLVDAEAVSFGVRTAVFDAARGFFLNGKPMKIQGTCNHQDHAGVGVALPDRLQAFRLGILRGMGCNAVRTSHNMPTPEWVEACDRMGFLMMCETRQMSANPEALQQLETMVKRFRNSPSIIIWSIGNEENQLQNKMAEQGARIAASMVQRCHVLDPTRVVSAAVNFDNERGVSIPLDIVGFNYNTRKYPATFHQRHPLRPVFGSETSSAISTRGEYADDPVRNLVNSYNGVVPWGETPEAWWQFYGTQLWEAGGFAWTGFDYRGEPTPYGWPSINSQFGIVDMCGFPKDYFFYYRAWWRSEPSLHLFPHWNWAGREGDEISVWVYSNLESIELFANGKSQGSHAVPALGHVEWKVRYDPGVIEARGSRNGAVVVTERRETTGAPAALRLTPDRQQISADGEDVSVLTVEVLDAQGRVVPTAKEKIAFKVSGQGRLIGVGNGDPNCLESDKAPARSAFNGLAQIIVQSTKTAGRIEVVASAEEWLQGNAAPVAVVIATSATALRPAVPSPAQPAAASAKS